MTFPEAFAISKTATSAPETSLTTSALAALESSNAPATKKQADGDYDSNASMKACGGAQRQISSGSGKKRRADTPRPDPEGYGVLGPDVPDAGAAASSTSLEETNTKPSPDTSSAVASIENKTVRMAIEQDIRTNFGAVAGEFFEVLARLVDTDPAHATSPLFAKETRALQVARQTVAASKRQKIFKASRV